MRRWRNQHSLFLDNVCDGFSCHTESLMSPFLRAPSGKGEGPGPTCQGREEDFAGAYATGSLVKSGHHPGSEQVGKQES